MGFYKIYHTCPRRSEELLKILVEMLKKYKVEILSIKNVQEDTYKEIKVLGCKYKTEECKNTCKVTFKTNKATIVEVKTK